MQPQGPPGSISGAVVSSQGEPIRKAEVTCLPLGAGNQRMHAMSDTSDASGAFECTDLAPGTYRIMVARNGYVSEEQANIVAARVVKPITVKPGENVHGISVKMIPHAVIAGRVTDDEGDPILRANVQLMKESWNRGKRTLVTIANDQTNDLGEYRLSGVAKGKYFVAANAGRGIDGPRRRASSNGEPSFTSTFYPGTREVLQAAAVEAGPAQEIRGIDIKMIKAATFNVRGTVVDPQGTPVTGEAMVSAIPESGELTGAMRGGGATTFNRAGAFVINGLTPGSYMLVTMSRSRAENSGAVGYQPIQITNRDVDNVVLAPQRLLDVSGALKVEGSETQQDLSRTTVTLSSDFALPLPPAVGKTGPDGRFTISNVSPLPQRLHVAGLPPGMYIKAARYGQEEILDVSFQPVNAGTPLDVSLSPKAGSLNATTVDADGKPLPNVLVVVAPEGAKRNIFRLYSNALSSESGAVSFRSLTPGNYKVFLFPPEIENAWQNPAFLAQHESRGTSVKIAESDNQTLQLTFAP